MLADAVVLRDRARSGGARDEQHERERRDPGDARERAGAHAVREHEPRDDSARDERDRDDKQGLRRVSSELLEGESVGEQRARAERADVAQQVQPAEPAQDHDRRKRPRRKRARRLVAASALWLAVGLYGLFAYGHGYYRYRGFAPPADPPGVHSGKLVNERFWSQAMRQRRSYQVYLPPGYGPAAARGQRFPVLYLLHGSPGSGDLFIDAGNIGVALDTIVSRHAVRPFLIVMPGGSDGTFMSDTEWADTPHGRYESLVLDTVRAVDARWPTIADRRHRAIAGNSEGGYGALNIAFRHVHGFSLVESWSGYYSERATGPFAGASPAAVAANSPSMTLATDAPALRRLPFAVALLASWHDRPYAALRFAAELRGVGVPVDARIASGGHTWSLWRREAPRMLEIVGRWFDPAR